jgi:hypothetical protein
VKGFALFALLSLVLVAGAYWLLGLIYAAPAERRALAVSAAVAYVVQLFAFAVARMMATTNVLAGWGVGVAMRLATLAVYALVIVEAFGLVPGAALFSLALFLFLSTLIEPPLLKL